MGYAIHRLTTAYDSALPGGSIKSNATTAIQLYWAQYALNLAWTPLFFSAHQTGLALANISIMTPLTFALTVRRIAILKYGVSN